MCHRNISKGYLHVYVHGIYLTYTVKHFYHRAHQVRTGVPNLGVRWCVANAFFTQLYFACFVRTDTEDGAKYH